MALGFHLAALIPLAALVLATGALAHVSAGKVAFFALLGSLGWLSYLAFYRALAIGPISLLSPIVSGYAAVTVILALAISGARLASRRRGDRHDRRRDCRLGRRVTACRARIDRRSMQGLALALAAMVLFGGFLFGVSYHRERIGWLAPIFLARAFTAAFLLVHARQRGGLRLREPSRIVVAIVALIALLDTGGYVFFNVGVRHAQTSVVATASAPYALVPVLMGVYLLRERPSRTQWLGVAIVGGGLVLLGSRRERRGACRGSVPAPRRADELDDAVGGRARGEHLGHAERLSPGTSSAGIVPPTVTATSSTCWSRSSSITRGTSVMWAPDRIDSPTASASSWITVSTICSGVWCRPV